MKDRRQYVTTDFVLTEFINYLYSALAANDAERIIESLLAKVDDGLVQLVHVSPDQFRHSWQMRRKYRGKRDISMIDFTSIVVMQELNIRQVFTGDAHFLQVNLGFTIVC